MPEVDAASLVALIHDAPIRLVLTITGGGSRAIAELLEVPGGSRTLLEAVVPYSAMALENWLGGAGAVLLIANGPGDGDGGVFTRPRVASSRERDG